MKNIVTLMPIVTRRDAVTFFAGPISGAVHLK
jgi:hypothetical protein